MNSRSCLALTLALLGLGCPAEVQHAPRKTAAPPPPPPAPMVDENDPRVVKDDEDLYAAQAVERRDPEPEGPAPGSGKPDESNGVCRLFAPQLEKPECCQHELGFDADTVQKSCGLDVYLGESFQASCGYFFHEAGDAEPRWFRMSVVDAAGPKEAVDAHVERLRVRQKAQDARAQKVPGVPGAWWTKHEGLAWAFIPGWSRVRQLAWRDTFCSDDAIASVIGRIAQAKEPGPTDRRMDLIPRART
jgi:hypothetical protein